MSNLAIKGHKHRGKEVIHILEMLGGKNVSQHKGNSDKLYIIQDGEIHLNFTTFSYCFKVFTLEEFIEKFPYKVGDRVKKANDDDGYAATVISMDWDSGIGEVMYTIIFDDHIGSTLDCLSVNLQPYEIKRVSAEFFDRYCKKCGSQRCTAEGEWLEGCKHYKRQESIGNKQFTDMLDTLSSYLGDILTPEGVEKAIKYIQKNMDEYIKPQYTNTYPQYPSNYEECIGKLAINWDGEVKGYKSDLLYNFQKLLIARAVYWKLAGEEMGLGKPWEPDWTDNSQKKFTISYYQGKINLTNGPNVHRVLSFPTAELRDLFYRNFKNLIEKCKELL